MTDAITARRADSALPTPAIRQVRNDHRRHRAAEEPIFHAAKPERDPARPCGVGGAEVPLLVLPPEGGSHKECGKSRNHKDSSFRDAPARACRIARPLSRVRRDSCKSASQVSPSAAAMSTLSAQRQTRRLNSRLTGRRQTPTAAASSGTHRRSRFSTRRSGSAIRRARAGAEAGSGKA